MKTILLVSVIVAFVLAAMLTAAPVAAQEAAPARVALPTDREGIGYPQWRIDRVFLLVPAQAYVAQWLQSFKEFPPRQKPASFSIDQVMQKLQEGSKQ